MRLAHSAIWTNSSWRSGLEQRLLAAPCRLEPSEAEVVPPPLQQRERRGVVVGRQGAPQQRQVLADQLLLQVDRVGADDGPFPVGLRPAQRGHQVGERLAHPGPGLQQRHPTVVVGVGDVGRHVALARPVLVAAELPGDRAILAEAGHHLERIEPLSGRALGEPRPPRRARWHRCRRSRSRPRRHAARAATVRSAGEGSRLPLGWLWNSISPRAAKPGSASTVSAVPRPRPRGPRRQPSRRHRRWPRSRPRAPARRRFLAPARRVPPACSRLRS